MAKRMRLENAWQSVQGLEYRAACQLNLTASFLQFVSLL